MNKLSSLARKARNRKGAGLLVALVGALIVAVIWGSGGTGAYFSDTHGGTVNGTIGTVHLSTNGGTGAQNMDFTFDNLLPGVPQTATVTYANTGTAHADFWLRFPNGTALSALNNLGTYGHVVVKYNGDVVFESSNLNDRSSTCGPFSETGCWPLPNKLLLASNVAPGDTGTVEFTFNYASKMTSQPLEGHFNQYPVADLSQTHIDPADGTGNGLPWAITAMQPGVAP